VTPTVAAPAGRRLTPADSAAKRALDVAVSAAALALLSPFFALLAVLIRLDSSGPVFFTQVRSGYRGGPFRMYKFRTMVQDAEDRLAEVLDSNVHEDPRLYKIPHDPRVTRVGAVLRRHSLDEVPQLINVLKGEMSLIGPRPLTPDEDRHVEGWARLRAEARPGITGPWQVSGRNALGFDEMMRLDCAYVAHWSIRGDLALLARTPQVVLRGQEAL
jgi:lipopolysaccharide/colanic/teichoic acid biosynthesis glycosyltransferase